MNMLRRKAKPDAWEAAIASGSVTRAFADGMRKYGDYLEARERAKGFIYYARLRLSRWIDPRRDRAK